MEKAISVVGAKVERPHSSISFAREYHRRGTGARLDNNNAYMLEAHN